VIRPTIRFCLHCIAATVAAATVVLAVGAWRLASGPISLGFISPYLQDALRESDSPYRFTFSDTVLTWAGWNRNLDILQRDVRILGPDGAVLAEAPELSLTLSLSALLRGIVAPTSIEIVAPRVRLVRDKDGRFVLGLGGEDGGGLAAPLFADLLAPPDPDRAMGYLTRLGIADADLTVIDRQLGAEWRTTSANLTVSRGANGIMAAADLRVAIAGHPLKLDVSARYPAANGGFTARVAFGDLVPAWLAVDTPELAALDMLRLPISGTIALDLDADMLLTRIGFDLASKAGKLAPAVAFPDAFADEPFAIASARAKGSIVLGDERLVLDKATIDLGGPRFTLAGTLEGFDKQPAIIMDATGADFPADLIARYWPRGLGATARAWVVANLRDGIARRAKARFRLRPEDYARDRLPREALWTRLEMDGITVDYFAPLPPIREASGTILIDARDLKATITGGAIGDLRIAKGTVRIADMGHADQTSVDLSFTGPLDQAVGILSHPLLGFTQRLDLDPRDLKGRVDGRLRLDVPLRFGTGFSNVKVSVEATLTDVVATDLIDGYDIGGGPLKMTIDDAGMDITGAATLNGIPVSFAWRDNFDDDAPFRRRYAVAGRFNDLARRGLGIPGNDYATGPADIDIDMLGFADGSRTWHISASLVDTVLRAPAIKWRKPAGVPGLLRLDARDLPGKPVTIKSFSLSAGDLDVGGGMTVGRDGRLRLLRLDRLAFGDNDLTVTVTARDGDYAIDIAGRSLDLTPFLAENAETVEPPTLPPLTISASIDHVLAMAGQKLDGVTATLDYREQRVEAARMTASLANGQDFALDIARDAKGRRLVVTADDAGAVFRAFDVYGDMDGGKLRYEALLDDSGAKDGPVRGVLTVDEFTIRDAPVLAKLLSVASLTGFFDLVTGDGLPFTRMILPSVKRGDRIEIRDGRAFGPALGLTAKGTIDLASDTLDLKGTLVPAYTLNNLFGKLPILGKLLVPTKGGGVFAISFKARGPAGDPKITVNPLSALTPGIFGVIFSGDRTPPSGEDGAPLSDSSR